MVQAADFPNKYDDPSYAQLDAGTEKKLSLPTGLLSSIRTVGERSNHNQVSEAGARTVYQITPQTRKLSIDKWGIDPYLSPQNASEVAGLLLKDSLDRNKGDASQAVGEYIGGTDRSNWGRKTAAYIDRVTTHFDSSRLDKLGSDFAQWMQSNNVQPVAAPTAAPQRPKPQGAGDLSAAFGEWLKTAPKETLPSPPPTTLEKVAALPGALVESFSGSKRATQETTELPDWARMPELNDLASTAGWKTGIGTLLTNPAEATQVIQANYPGVQVRQDEKGNFILRSSLDHKEYAIKPGFQFSDIPRAGSAIAAFTPAGRAATLPGMAAAAGGTQAAIEASQAATGGNFDPGDVATAAALGPAVPLVSRGVGVLRGMAGDAASRIMGRAETGAPVGLAGEQAAAMPRGAPADVAAPVAAPSQQTSAMQPGDAAIRRNADTDIPVRFKGVEPKPGADGRPYARVEVNGRESFVPADELVPHPQASSPAAAAPEMSPADLTDIAKRAAGGSKEAEQSLAAAAAPDAKTLEAAKRLGVEDYLQPDHVSSSQVYRELAQAVKSIPGSEARAAEVQGLEQVGQRAAKVIEDIGGSDDMSALSATVKQAKAARLQQLEEQEKMLYGKVRTAIKPTTPSPADDTLDYLKQRANELGGADNLSPMERTVIKRLTPINGRQPTYALLDDVRKDVGAVTMGKGPFVDADTGLAKQVYARLANDQFKVAQASGQEWSYRAAQYATQLKKGVQDDLTALFGKQLDQSLAPEVAGAMRALPQGNSDRLVNLLQMVPKSMRQEVVASGLSTAMRTQATRGPIGFAQYAKFYEGLLRNKKSYAAVMSTLPGDARKQLSDLYRVSRAIAAASRERIATGRIQAVQDQFRAADSLAGRLYDAAKQNTVAVAAGTVLGHIPVVGPGIGAAVTSALTKGAKPAVQKAVDALIASPEFISATRAAGTKGEAAAVKKLAKSAAFKRFMAAAGHPPEMTHAEKWIQQAMAGGAAASANVHPSPRNGKRMVH